MHFITPHLRTALCACAVGLLGMTSTQAQSLTWIDGNANNDWDFAEPNWDNGIGATTWTDNNTAIFGANLGEAIDLTADVVVTDLRFELGGSGRGEGEYTIDSSNGSSITITGNLYSNAQPDNNGGGGNGINTIGADLILTNGAHSFTVRRIGQLIVNGDISETGGSASINIQRIQNNGNEVFLNGDNSFSGGLSFTNGGTVHAGSATAFGTGTVTTASTAEIGNSSGGDLVNTNNNALQIGATNGTGVTYIGTDDYDFGTGAVTILNESQEIGVEEVGATFTLGGAIGDDGNGFGIIKEGAGTLALGGDSTFTGDVLINEGTVQMLAGSGMTFDIENLSMSNSFIGDGSVSFDGLFVLDVDTLTDTSGTWNLVDVATLTETFEDDFGLEFLGGSSFVTNDGGLTWTSGDWSFDTLSGNLSLMAIPEPTSAALLIGAIGLLALRRRR